MKCRTEKSFREEWDSEERRDSSKERHFDKRDKS